MPSIDELVSLVESRGPAPSPAARLQTAIELGRDLSDLGDALIGRFVAQARAAGLSWTEIGRLFGTTKQAVEHSRRIADGLGAPVAGTEHLLAGIVAVPESMAVEILRRLKLGPDAVRSALAERLGVEPDRL